MVLFLLDVYSMGQYLELVLIIRSNENRLSNVRRILLSFGRVCTDYKSHLRGFFLGLPKSSVKIHTPLT